MSFTKEMASRDIVWLRNCYQMLDVLIIKKTILRLVAKILNHKTSVECEEDEEAPYLDLIDGQA